MRRPRTEIIISILCMVILASQTTPVVAQDYYPFDPESAVPVTPWQAENDRALRLLGEAVLSLKGCDLEEARGLAQEIDRLGAKIRYDYGQAEEGANVQKAAQEVRRAADALQGGGEYVTQPPVTSGGRGIRLGPCRGVSSEFFGVVVGLAAVIVVIVARAIFGPKGSKAPKKPPFVGKVRPKPVFGRKGRQMPGKPIKAPPTPGGYRYEQPRPSPITHEIPPQPIVPGGLPIGGKGITTGPPPLHPGVQNLRAIWPPGQVHLKWDPPQYDPNQEVLKGYFIHISEQVPWSTAPVTDPIGPWTDWHPRGDWPKILPPNAIQWQGPHVQTYHWVTDGDIRGYIVEPIYESIVGGTKGRVYTGPGTLAPAMSL